MLQMTKLMLSQGGLVETIAITVFRKQTNNGVSAVIKVSVEEACCVGVGTVVAGCMGVLTGVWEVLAGCREVLASGEVTSARI